MVVRCSSLGGVQPMEKSDETVGLFFTSVLECDTMVLVKKGFTV